MANEKFIEAAGEAANGVIMPAAKLIVLDQLPEDEPQIEALQEYHDMFVAEYNREPDHYGGHAWDALHIVKQAIERAGADADSAAIRDEIEKTEEFVGIGGIFTYGPDDHYGLSPEAFAMVQIQDGDWVLLEE
ncbi:MAG: ABC transporter substrate-binding protein [Armatimonadia bacterium]|nr:ABC transporter substrate-binding protein [Armatimonadia bacterium]